MFVLKVVALAVWGWLKSCKGFLCIVLPRQTTGNLSGTPGAPGREYDISLISQGVWPKIWSSECARPDSMQCGSERDSLLSHHVAVA